MSTQTLSKIPPTESLGIEAGKSRVRISTGGGPYVVRRVSRSRFWGTCGNLGFFVRSYPSVDISLVRDRGDLDEGGYGVRNIRRLFPGSAASRLFAQRRKEKRKEAGGERPVGSRRGASSKKQKSSAPRWIRGGHDEVFVEDRVGEAIPPWLGHSLFSAGEGEPEKSEEVVRGKKQNEPYPFLENVDYWAGAAFTWHCRACGHDFNAVSPMYRSQIEAGKNKEEARAASPQAGAPEPAPQGGCCPSCSAGPLMVDPFFMMLDSLCPETDFQAAARFEKLLLDKAEGSSRKGVSPADVREEERAAFGEIEQDKKASLSSSYVNSRKRMERIRPGHVAPFDPAASL